MLKAIFAVAALLSATNAAAQTRLEVPATASWKHAQTDIVLRPKLAGLQRTELKDLTNDELDVSASYSGPDGTWGTIYVFRPALPSLAMWFDRAETAILVGDSWKGAKPLAAPMIFTPPGGTVPSGLSRIYVPGTGAKAISTAVAIMPYKDWLVSVRLSSASMEPAALGRLLPQFVQGIQLPADPQPKVAALLQPCTDMPRYDRRAKLVKPDTTSALLGALIATTAAQEEAKDIEPSKPVTWCKQTGSADYGVYRAVGQKNSYVMALGDAGIVANVSPALTLDMSSAYQLSVKELDRTLVYPNFNRLPAPERAWEALRTAKPVSSSTGGNNIMIGS